MDERARRYAVPAAVTAAVVVASVADPPAAAGRTVAVGPIGADKVAHAVGYAVLTTSLLYAGGEGNGPGRRTALAVLAAVALGLALEGVQATLPARTFSPGDAVANAVGALAAAAGWLYGGRRRR